MNFKLGLANVIFYSALVILATIPCIMMSPIFLTVWAYDKLIEEERKNNPYKGGGKASKRIN